MSPKSKRQPPNRDFDKYFATFQSDPLKKSVGLKGVNPLAWKQLGPIISGSSGYVEYLQELSTGSASGYNTSIKPVGFGFNFNGVTYRDFIASPHGWISLLDPSDVPTSSLDTIYNNRFLSSGSSSYVNSAIKQEFSKNDLFLAPWFDRLMMTHRDLDSFVSFFSGSNDSLSGQKENFLYGKVSSKNQPYNEFDYGMKYAVVDDSVDGKSLVVRWSSMGYEYRGFKLSFEAALYENGKIEFNYAPLDYYSTQYTLLGLSSDPQNVWKLDETAGSSVTDAMSNYSLSYYTPNNMRPSAGTIGTAAFFSGTWSNFIIADSGGSPEDFARYNVSDSFSFSCWFKTALGDSSTKTLLGRMNYDDAPRRGYMAQVAGGYVQFELANTNSVYSRIRTSSDPYNDAAWHHLVVTYDGSGGASGMKMYLDGALASTTVVNDTLGGAGINGPDGGTRFLIGARGRGASSGNTNNFFTGSIDDVARWNSTLSSSDVDLIYQNGLSGNSAADIDLIGDSTTSYATCGIFASGSSAWNYRDFAPLLGVVTSSRAYSDFGGAIYTGSYSDIDAESNLTASYAVNIGINNWPKYGGRITFSPPKIRRNLIRTDANIHERRSYFSDQPFDDRRVINYVTQSNIDAATVLPLSAIVNPSYPGVHLKQNLISSGGLRTQNRKVISAAHVGFMDDERYLSEKLEPFAEDSPSAGRLSDTFFSTGSISAFGESTNSFSRSIENKKQIKLSFQVDKKTKMYTSGSSLFYFNPASSQWNIPTRSLADHVTSSFSKLAVRTTDVGGSVDGSLYLEDQIGFDSQGNSVASGSLNIFRSTPGATERNQSTSEIGDLYRLNQHVGTLIPEYAKSIQRNSDYSGTADECFTIGIDEPFLIEKAVIEIPFCMGDSWFNDRTTYLISSASNFAFTASGGSTSALSDLTWTEEGGPAITVSMFCQRNHGTGSVRDLVFKSTFSHVDDKQIVVNFSDLSSGSATSLIHVASLAGNDNNTNIKSDYVTYQLINSKKVFTGSVLIKADAAVTNCANVATYKIFNMSSYSSSGSMLSDFESFLNTEFVSVNNITSPLQNLTYLLGFDSFGRSMSGFSAGSGGEFVTSKDVLFGNSIRNPFYFTGSSYRQQVTSSLESRFATLGTGSSVYCVSKVSLGKQQQSPYLVYPEDKFILAVSKTRPTYRSADIRIGTSNLTTGKINTLVSSSYFYNINNREGHDVFFNTGSIKITLYGSEVKLGGEVQ